MRHLVTHRQAGKGAVAGGITEGERASDARSEFQAWERIDTQVRARSASPRSLFVAWWAKGGRGHLHSTT